MNIYRRELNVNRKGLLIWSVILAGLGILVLAFFPTIAKQAEQFQQLMASMPAGLLAAFGLEEISMTDIMGYYATKQYTTLALFGSIYAIILGSAMLTREEGEKTIEFLLAKPVSRSEILTAKLLSLITLITIFNLLITIVMYISLEIVKTVDFSVKTFLLLSVAAWLLHLTFAALGFLAAVIIRKSQTVFPFCLGLVLVTYFLSIITALSEKLEFLKYVSPFKYVDAVDIITQMRIEPQYLIIIAIINIVAIIMSYIIYNKKDFSV